MMVLVLGVLTLTLAAQAGPIAQPASVTGVIRDAETGAPLAGAVVSLADLGRGVLTDEQGRYAISSVPAGPQHVVVERIGYGTRTLHLLVPGSGTTEFNVSLRPSPIPLEELPVAPTRPVRGLDPTDSTDFPDRGITHTALRYHPTLAQTDPLRALAGGEVLVDPEAPTGVHVRGGAADHTGYLLDGIPVLNPYHAAGLFSAWNPDALAGLQLAGAAPSPALPDALSGAIEARTLDPGPGFRLQSTLSNTEARVTVDGPIAGAVTYLLSWRTGLAGALSPRGEASAIASETGDFVGKLRVPALGGHLQLLVYDSENEVSSPSVVLEDDNQPGAPAPPNSFEWTSRSAGASWSWNRSRFMAVRLGLWSAASDAGSRWHADGSPSNLESTRRDIGFDGTVERHSARSVTEAGVRFRRMATAYRIRAQQFPTLDAAGATAVLTGFAQHSRKLGSSVEAWAGAAASVAGDELRLAPRARVRWRPVDGIALTAAYSRTHQFAQSLRNPESVVGHVFPADLFLGSGVAGVPVPESDQMVIAAELRAAPGIRVGTQAFSRRLDKLLLVAPMESGPFASAAFTIGSGTARGASLELAASGARYGLVASYGLHRVRVFARESAYAPRHGTAHTVDAGIMVFPNATSSLRLAATAASGRTATAVSGPFEWETCSVADPGCEFAGSPALEGPLGGTHLPPYVRVDVGARKHWHVTVRGRDVLMGVFGTVTNIFGRYNTLAYTVDPDTGEREPVQMLPRTPLVVGIDTRF